MARELTLLREDPPGQFFPEAKFGLYLCTAKRESKAAILRYVLEQYEPYRTFKARLELTGIVGEAATQTKALHNIEAHRQVIGDTFTDLGNYTKSLISEGVGLYQPRCDDPKEYLIILDKVIQERETAKLQVCRRLGEETVDWINAPNVLENLITAYQCAAEADKDPRAPILHAGNAVESFLSQIAVHHMVNVTRAHGINAKGIELANANHLTTKHKAMVMYLGHVRNACDHGVDAEIGTQWDISQKTAIEYVHVAQSVISAIVKQINGIYTV